MPSSPHFTGVNLLRFKPVRELVHWSGFPYVFQGAMLIVLVALGVVSWQQYAPDGVADGLYARTNLVQLLIWGLWWPAMVWAAVLLGRAWCMVCPLELVANVSERLSRQVGIQHRVLGRWLRSGFAIVALYAVIQMLVAGIHLHRVPAYTSFFLFGLIGSAAIVGSVFKDRAFCRGFCPVGLLLGTYGRGGMLAVRHESTEQCDDCTSHDCVLACHHTRWQGRSCPSLLNPARLDSNRDCLVCGQCIKGLTAGQHAAPPPSSLPRRRRPGRTGLLAGGVVCDARLGICDLRSLYGMGDGTGGLPVGARTRCHPGKYPPAKPGAVVCEPLKAA